jgi:hypothetical protein
MRRLMMLAATGLLAAACGGVQVPNFTIPPIQIPSIPPIDLPSGGFPGLSIPPGNAQCALVTAAEVGSILGTTVTDASDEASNCTFISSTLQSLSVSTDSSTDLSGVQFLMGENAQQVTIGGFPALSGTVFSLPAVYVQKPSGQLQVLGFLVAGDAEMQSKLQQIATIAVGRMP